MKGRYARKKEQGFDRFSKAEKIVVALSLLLALLVVLGVWLYYRLNLSGV